MIPRPALAYYSRVEMMADLFETRHTGPHRVKHYVRHQYECDRCAMEMRFMDLNRPAREMMEWDAAEMMMQRMGKTDPEDVANARQ